MYIKLLLFLEILIILKIEKTKLKNIKNKIQILTSFGPSALTYDHGAAIVVTICPVAFFGNPDAPFV